MFEEEEGGVYGPACAACEAQIRDELGALVPACQGFEHLSNPWWNLKLACEELTLLEQHLCDPAFRCAECIRKHFLYLQGILREAMRIDTQGVLCAYLDPMTHTIHLCGVRWSEGWEPYQIGQLLRRVRARVSTHFGIV